MPRSAKRPRLAPIPLILFAVLLLVPVVIASIADGDPPATTPTSTTAATAPSVGTRPPIVPADVEPGPTDPPPITTEVESYRIVYEVRSYGPAGSVIDTEIHEVSRPFHTRVETLTGAPPGTETSAVATHGFGFTEVGDAERATPLVNEPTLPLGEVGVASDLTDALDAGVLVHLAETREILDRPCTRYRTGSTIDVGVLTPPTSSDWADICIDEAGLVLAESWVVDGELLRRRTAVDLELEVHFAPARFAPRGDAAAYREGGGLISAVTVDSEAPDAPHWWLPTAPAGLEYRGRYGFAAPTATASDDQPEVRVIGLVDVYQSGTDAVMIVNAGTTDRGDAFGDLGGDTVDLGDLGIAAVRRRARGAELLLSMDRGRLLRIHGTLPLDRLVELALALVESPPSPDSTITALEDETLFGPTTTEPDHDHDDRDPDDHVHGEEVTDHTHS